MDDRVYRPPSRQFHDRIRRNAEQVVAASGARAVVEIESGYPETYNDPGLVARMQPTLAWEAPPNHSPRFDVDEATLVVGVRPGGARLGLPPDRLVRRRSG